MIIFDKVNINWRIVDSSNPISMSKIEYTNIIIDDFSIAKRDTSRRFVHILTHIHAGINSFIQIISKDSTTIGT
jgi:hypothetical protein